MKRVLSKLGILGNPGSGDGHYSAHLLDNQYQTYVEEYFRERLAFERKRTERSGHPFLLMLIDITGLPADSQNCQVRKKVVKALSCSTRETDLKGWYIRDRVFGIIFSELKGVDKKKMLQMVKGKMAECVPRDQFEKIMISLHLFPEDAGTGDLTLYPDLSQRERRKRLQFMTKRGIDIFGSVFGLVIFLPLFLIIALVIKVSSPGPLLFRQKRLGRYGRPFEFLKFRTMYVNNDPNIHKEYIRKFISEQKSFSGEGGKAVFKINNDPRVTKIGRFLRKTSLDEVPQFINVLRGEMSLVGPRPPIPYELENYDVWHRRRIFEIKPGITGLWQVKGRSSTTFAEMVRLDLQYINEWSLGLDFKILFRTPLAVIQGKGAY